MPIRESFRAVCDSCDGRAPDRGRDNPTAALNDALRREGWSAETGPGVDPLTIRIHCDGCEFLFPTPPTDEPITTCVMCDQPIVTTEDDGLCAAHARAALVAPDPALSRAARRYRARRTPTRVTVTGGGGGCGTSAPPPGYFQMHLDNTGSAERASAFQRMADSVERAERAYTTATWSAATDDALGAPGRFASVIHALGVAPDAQTHEAEWFVTDEELAAADSTDIMWQSLRTRLLADAMRALPDDHVHLDVWETSERSNARGTTHIVAHASSVPRQFARQCLSMFSWAPTARSARGVDPALRAEFLRVMTARLDDLDERDALASRAAHV